MGNRINGIISGAFGGIAGFTLARSQTYDFYPGYGMALFSAVLSICFLIRSLNCENGRKRDDE